MRHVDVFSIYIKSEKAVLTADSVIYMFLKGNLKLQVNLVKRDLRRPVDFQILYYGFVSTYRKGNKVISVDSEKGWGRLKIKSITLNTTPSAFEDRITKLKEAQGG